MQVRFFVKIIIVIFAVITITGYAYYQTKNLIAGPQIEIHTPKNGSSVQEKLIILEGTARNISKINLNDFPVYVDQNGVFKEKLLLSEGYNVIKFSIWDRFNRTKDEKLEIVYLKNKENLEKQENIIN